MMMREQERKSTVCGKVSCSACCTSWADLSGKLQKL